MSKNILLKPVQAQPNVLMILPFGREGAAVFNKFRDQLLRHFMMEHPGMGPFIETLEYRPIVFDHIITEEIAAEANMVAGVNGVTGTMVKTWKEEVQKLRIKRMANDQIERERDLGRCYAKMMTCLTDEGIAQIQNLDNWGEINTEKDPLILWSAIVRTHSTAIIAGTEIQIKHESFSDYVMFKQEKDMNLHDYG